MKKVWHNFKSFWTAEEVPRWFGLSLVVVYLCGLGGVAHFGISAARNEALRCLEQSGRYTVETLADRLAGLSRSHGDVGLARLDLQRELLQFTTHVPSRFVRVVNEHGEVLASSEPATVGTTAAVPDSAMDGTSVATVAAVEGEWSDLLVRVPMAASITLAETAGTTAEPEDAKAPLTLLVEARLTGHPQTTSVFATHGQTLTVILVAFGILFGLYRCLRAQLRGMSRIADRLRSHRDRIEQDLASLRIGDSLDSATSAWNQLVELTESLLQTVQRTEANEELKHALERTGRGALAEAMNAVPDGIIYITDEVRFEYMNTTACRLIGWDPHATERSALTDAQAVGVGASILDLVRNALTSEGSFQATAQLVTEEQQGTNNSSYRVLVIPLHRHHHEGECIVLIRDVSQQMRADRAREDFVTQVTHELRTPLTNIRAYAETLSSGMFDDPKVITECYNVITKETRRLSRLIEDILSVSQLEVGSIELHVDNVELTGLLEDGVRDIRGLADEKNIDVQVMLPSKAEPIRGDRDKLAVVINNLLGNAIKYTPRGGSVIVACQFTGDQVAMTVKDNGIGVDPMNHSRIFEKFQRGDDAETLAETGTGIGLYTAREIVRRHGGEIELISQRGAGSTFMVRLPHKVSRAVAKSAVQEV